MNSTDLKRRVRDHYSARIARHGPTPLGVDWQNQVAQQLRFMQLVKICNFDAPFSINDFGCGYGAILGYFAEQHRRARIEYRGIDLSPPMIAAARKLWARRPQTSFVIGSKCRRRADYSIASGVFNVRLGQPVASWETYVQQILHDLLDHSRVGIAVNFMLPHDDAPTEDELYRTAMRPWIMFCRNELGCTVRPVKAYGLREFTLLVRRRM